MTKPITIEQLQNASRDAKTLEQVVNGDENTDVTSRLGATYPTLDKALKTIVEKAPVNATSFTTHASLLADTALTSNALAFVHNDSDASKNGLYQKIGSNWIYQAYNQFAQAQAKAYIDSAAQNQITESMSDMLKFGATVVVDADSDIRAMGFEEMAQRTADSRPFLVHTTRINTDDYFFARVYVKSATPNKFGTPRLYFWQDSKITGNVLLSLERKINDNIAIYYLSSQYKYSNADRVLIGADGGQAVDNFMIFGLQFAKSTRQISTINNHDYHKTTADVSNIVRSIDNKAIANLQKPTAKYNTKITYGQSLAAGQESYPSLSKQNYFDNLTLGDNVRPAQLDGNSYPTFGDAVLKPLKASVINSGGNAILTDDVVATLPTGFNGYGEPIDHGFVNFAKFLFNQKMMLDNDTDRLFVTINPAVSGRTIEQLSKNNTQDSVNRYGRFLDGLQKVHAATNNESHVVDSIAWLQGEWNYKNNGGTYDKQSYITKLNQLIADMKKDTMSITKQKLPPAFFIYQTGASYTIDIDSGGNAGLHVGMAQLEIANARNDTFMFSPVYAYTDKNGHLDSNGYRWLGNQLAKVYKHVVLDGKNWSPLQPIRIAQKERQIRIDFYVPVPPIKKQPMYLANAAIEYAALGFRVTKKDGAEITIADVDVFDTYVIITLDTNDTANLVWYASQATQGGGNLCDSDNTVAFDKYEYVENSGMYESANISKLNNKPYPLNNWCVAFCLPVGYIDRQFAV